MRYLAPILSAALAIPGCCAEKPEEPKSMSVVREISVSGKEGSVHFWQVDGKTCHIEVSWSENTHDSNGKYTLSANGGRRFYDIGELEGNFENIYTGFADGGKFVLDAENPNACRELIRLSKTANRVRDTVMAENNIADEPVYSTEKFIIIGSEKYRIGD